MKIMLVGNITDTKKTKINCQTNDTQVLYKKLNL